jgi:hypothetical protein
MPVVIVPGFHARSLTLRMVRSLPPFVQPHVTEVFPADPIAVLHWLTQTFGSPHASDSKKDSQESRPTGLIAIGFSAGVVGLAGALSLWQQQGGSVARFFAVDGWGVPIAGLPLCRLSHDYFTHWSSQLLGAGEVNFYADPPVAHLEMWGEADRVIGQVIGRQSKATERCEESMTEKSVTMAAFLRQQLTVERAKRAKQSI